MKIIREGDRDAAYRKKRHIVQFICDKCGCIWDAEETEYHMVSNGYNELYAACNCPTCGEKEYEKICMDT